MKQQTYATVAALICGLISAPAMAQQTDSEKILQLLQGMNQKFDAIENRLDKLEGGAGSNQPAVAAAATKKATPGWQLELYPYGNGSFQDTPVGRKHVPIGPVPFKLTLKSAPVSSYVEYRGKAFFKAASAGQYGFGIDVDASSGNQKYFGLQYSCIPGLSVDDQPVITREEKDTDFSATGGINLQEGTYELSFRLSCRSNHDPYGKAPDEQDIEILGNTKFAIQVIGPDDGELRPFKNEELFTVSAQ